MREQIDQTIVVEQLGVSAQDPFTIATGLATLLLVAALASLLPARCATTVEPTTALRCE
jgi:ABC-type lipoprotein release transport system permease subunit